MASVPHSTLDLTTTSGTPNMAYCIVPHLHPGTSRIKAHYNGGTNDIDTLAAYGEQVRALEAFRSAVGNVGISKG